MLIFNMSLSKLDNIAYYQVTIKTISKQFLKFQYFRQSLDTKELVLILSSKFGY